MPPQVLVWQRNLRGRTVAQILTRQPKEKDHQPVAPTASVEFGGKDAVSAVNCEFDLSVYSRTERFIYTSLAPFVLKNSRAILAFPYCSVITVDASLNFRV